MKKVLLAIAVIALIGCASCSKTKVCHCYYDYTTLLSNEQKTLDLGQQIINEGNCSDLEDENSFANINFGTLGTGKVRCERE